MSTYSQNTNDTKKEDKDSSKVKIDIQQPVRVFGKIVSEASELQKSKKFDIYFLQGYLDKDCQFHCQNFTMILSKSFGKPYEELKLIEGAAIKHGKILGKTSIGKFGVTETYMDYYTKAIVKEYEQLDLYVIR